jgi:hypothetical protein
MNCPGEIQEKVLGRIIRENENTLFGREYLFREVASAQDYARCVPLSTYSDLNPYIQAMISGEKKVLVDEPVGAWMRTDGITGGVKLLPYTAGIAKSFQEAFLRVFTACAAEGIFPEEGKVMAGLEGLCSDLLGEIPTGCMSSLQFRAMKKIPVVTDMITPSQDVAGISNAEKRWMEIAAHVSRENVVAAVADPVLFLAFLRKMLTEYRRCVQSPREMWPNFSLIISDTDADPYRKAFNTILGDVEIREVFCTDEMVVAVQMDTEGYVPLYDSYFLEFISLKEWKEMESEGGIYREHEFDSQTIDTAARGEEYILVLTTPGGLYRYLTGEVVKILDNAHIQRSGWIDQQKMGTAQVAEQHMVLLREVARDELELTMAMENQVVAIESKTMSHLFGIR